MYLIDTNILSETLHPARGDRRAVEWLDRAHVHELYLSAITDFELEIGVLMKERRDPQGAPRYRAWLGEVRKEFTPRILPITPEIARTCAMISVPDRRPLADAFIAATALHHGLTVVTRNVRDFDVPGLSVFNPFD